MKLFIGLGLLLVFGGLAASVLVLPGLVLEYGITVVVGGIVAPTGGLVLIGIGVLLKRLQRLEARLERFQPGAEPAMAPTGPEAALGAGDRPAAPLPAKSAEPEPQGELFPAQGSGSAPIVIAGVAAAAGGLAASRISPFDKIERALEDVLETTRGEARQLDEQAEEGRDGSGTAQDSSADEAGQEAADEALTVGGAFYAPDDTRAAEGEAPDEGPAEDPAPVSSDEGIVRVYTIGESSFTMYASGIIRAQTPEGALTFATMDELKAYLDTRPATLMAKA